jgi:hypothetical protein
MFKFYLGTPSQPFRRMGGRQVRYTAEAYLDATDYAREYIIVSSTDSGLEAFSHNPADGSFAALPDRTGANTNYVNQRFLSY